MDYGLTLWTKVCVMDTQLLSSQGINCSTGVVCIIVMCLSDSHYDGTHSLQSMHC